MPLLQDKPSRKHKSPERLMRIDLIGEFMEYMREIQGKYGD